MSSGSLGKIVSVNGNFVPAYTVPATGISWSVISINCVNVGVADATIKIAIGTSATPGKGDHIEFNTVLAPGAVLERTGIVCSPSEIVQLYANSNDVVMRVHGAEQLA